MIRIVQCLCGPARHCILAIPYSPGVTAAQSAAAQAKCGDCDITLTEANAAAYLRSMVEGLIARGVMDPWCGICGSRAFVCEDARTRFETMEGALPEMQKLAQEQLRLREMIDALKRQAGQN